MRNYLNRYACGADPHWPISISDVPITLIHSDHTKRYLESTDNAPELISHDIKVTHGTIAPRSLMSTPAVPIYCKPLLESRMRVYRGWASRTSMSPATVSAMCSVRALRTPRTLKVTPETLTTEMVMKPTVVTTDLRSSSTLISRILKDEAVFCLEISTAGR